jgi:hypothetical protein
MTLTILAAATLAASPSYATGDVDEQVHGALELQAPSPKEAASLPSVDEADGRHNHSDDRDRDHGREQGDDSSGKVEHGKNGKGAEDEEHGEHGHAGELGESHNDKDEHHGGELGQVGEVGEHGQIGEQHEAASASEVGEHKSGESGTTNSSGGSGHPEGEEKDGR